MDEFKSSQNQSGKKRKKRRKRNPFVEFLQIYAKYIIMAVLLILVVVAVILVVGKLRGGDTGETDPTVINVDPSSSESESAASLEPTDNQEINDLVDAYFTAVAACDMDALSRLLYSTEGITQEQLEAEREYVEGYEDITCYSLDGLIDGTYIVYVSYGMKFINVETPAPSLIRLYICTNDEGEMYIYNQDVGTDNEVAAYMEEVDARDDVRALSARINDQLTEAMAADEDLNALVNRLYGQDTGDGSEGESQESSAEETEAQITFTDVDETVYATETVRVRSTPSTEGAEVGALSGGESVRRTGYHEEWSRVEYDGQTCYVSSDYLTTTEPETEASEAAGDIEFESVDETVYATQNVRVRNTPSTDGEEVGRLAGGQSVTRTGYSESWSRVEYDGETCYVSSEYLTTVAPADSE